MKAVVLRKTGDSKVLKVTDEPMPVVGDNEVLVNIKFTGINYADILSRQGLYNWMGELPYTLGLEGSGVITEVGDKVSKFKVGDAVVIGGKSGTYAEYVSRSEDSVFKIPDFMSLEQACILPGAWLTAWVAMFELGRIRPKQTILIHSAAGGVGTAALQLAKAHDLAIYGTASDSKHEHPALQGITPLSYADFDQKLEQENIFPDFILESVGGDVHERSKKILAPLGKMVSLGASSIKLKNKLNPLEWYNAWKALPRINRSDLSSQGYMSLHIGYLFEDSYDYLEPCWYRMIDFMATHKLVPEVNQEQILPMSKVGQAHDLIDNRQNIGKVILVPGE